MARSTSNINEEGRKEWIKLIQLQKEDGLEQNVTMCLIKHSFIHYSFQSPLHMASEIGYLALVKFLLENLDTVPMKKNMRGFTPFYLAVQKGHAEVVRVLAPLTENPK